MVKLPSSNSKIFYYGQIEVKQTLTKVLNRIEDRQIIIIKTDLRKILW